MNHRGTNESKADVQERVVRYQKDVEAIRREVASVLVGQDEAIHQVLAVLLSGGHALIEGVPGTGKTLLVRALAHALALKFRRVQFTPDLLPADILGYDTLLTAPGGAERIEFREGPIFTQFLLADEINRGTPRTQSALLEAMQERQVTIGTATRTLDPLLTVYATRNPIEMEGTYPLPEAQLDRFQMQIDVGPASIDELVAIAEQTTTGAQPSARQVVSEGRLLEMRAETRNVIVARPLLDYAAYLIRASQPAAPEAPAIVRELLRYGGGVRALQGIVLAAKVTALCAGRFHVARADLERHMLPVLRHRFLYSLEGEARGIEPEELIREILRHAAAKRSLPE